MWRKYWKFVQSVINSESAQTPKWLTWQWCWSENIKICRSILGHWLSSRTTMMMMKTLTRPTMTMMMKKWSGSEPFTSRPLSRRCCNWDSDGSDSFHSFDHRWWWWWWCLWWRWWWWPPGGGDEDGDDKSLAAIINEADKYDSFVGAFQIALWKMFLLPSHHFHRHHHFP